MKTTLEVKALPSDVGGGIVAIMRSIWLMVDVPWKRGFPKNISARIHPRLHMSIPWVYLQFTCWIINDVYTQV
jgi:hypothetical protein